MCVCVCVCVCVLVCVGCVCVCVCVLRTQTHEDTRTKRIINQSFTSSLFFPSVRCNVFIYVETDFTVSVLAETLQGPYVREMRCGELYGANPFNKSFTLQ